MGMLVALSLLVVGFIVLVRVQIIGYHTGYRIMMGGTLRFFNILGSTLILTGIALLVKYGNVGAAALLSTVLPIAYFRRAIFFSDDRVVLLVLRTYKSVTNSGSAHQENALQEVAAIVLRRLFWSDRRTQDFLEFFSKQDTGLAWEPGGLPQLGRDVEELAYLIIARERPVEQPALSVFDHLSACLGFRSLRQPSSWDRVRLINLRYAQEFGAEK